MSKHIYNTISEALSNNKFLSGIFLGESGQLIAESEFNEELHTYRELRIYYISSGNGILSKSSKNVTVHQGDVFFQLSDDILTFQTDVETTAELWWIDIYGSSVNSFNENLPIQNIPICNISDPRFMYEFKGIIDYDGNLSLADALHIQSGLYKIFEILVEECTTSQWTIATHDEKTIMYTGKWKLWPSPKSDMHVEAYTAEPKAYAEYAFYGTGIKWFGTMNFDCGKADVIIDGNYQTTIDTYNPTRLSKQLLYINTKLQYNHHVVKIFCTGEKNDKATNCDVVIESFQSQSLYSNSTDEKNSSTLLIKKACDIIKESYNRDIPICGIADILGISRSYFTSRFSSEQKISPLRYLIQIRISKAKELLSTTDNSICEIACAVGYHDVFYFSRLFKKEEHITPTQYRKMYRIS